MKNKAQKNQTRTMIGGQAVLEGVMMRGKTAMAIAVRNNEGDILLETERIKPKKKAAKLPVIRGVVAFGSSLVTGINTISKSANALGDEDEQLGKGGMAFAIILGMLIAVGVFFFLPMLVSGLIYEKVYQSILVESLISGVLRVGLFIGYLALVSRLKDIRRTFMYHGAEHRTINCFEKGLPLTVENVQKCSTRHNRCGTTFLFLVMMISIIVFAVVNWGLTTFIDLKGAARQFTFMGIKLLFLPLVAGLSYEVLFLFAKMPDNWFTNILRAPGLALQRLSTKQPDDDMAEVAITSFLAVLEMEANPAKKIQKFDDIPVQQAKKIIAQTLDALDAEAAEGQWLLCAVTGRKRSELGTLERLNRKEYSRLKELLNKRKDMPLDYCLGTSSFYGRDIMVDKRVLIPRMETEILAETAIKVIGDSECEVLDLCTGSGCIAFTLAKETDAIITASDISKEALEVAAKNLQGLPVELVESDLFDGLEGRTFDVIVCNPPYVRTGDIGYLQTEVRCQPHIALDGGEDGLEFYRRIAISAAEYLNKSGTLLLEIGYDQAETVSRLLRSIGGFKSAEIIKDLDGLDRVVKAEIMQSDAAIFLPPKKHRRGKKAADNSVEKAGEKFGEQAGEKSFEKAIEKMAEKLAEMSVEKSAEK